MTAHDMGHPPRYSSLPALVIVTVEDVNDSPPSFSSPSIEIDLVLPSVEGVKLATIHANDVDTVGEIRYYMRGEDGGRGLFRLESKSGDLLLLTGDRKNFTEKSYKVSRGKEKEREGTINDVILSFQLDVLSTDGVHSTSQEVRIKVKNGSQSDLRFSQSVYVATLEENPSIPSPVPLITVQVGQKKLNRRYSNLHQASLISNPNEEVYYSLQNTREDFSIIPSTGLISYVGESIDREEKDHVLLLVQVRY